MSPALLFARALLGAGVAFGGPSLTASPYISEFMASNKTTCVDADGAYSDWIELHNPDAAPLHLDGWFLTDNAANKTKWRFPAVTVEPNGFLLVFASDKDRRDPTRELHTNFALSAEGEYLGLVAPDGVTVVADYAPAFPAQAADVSFGYAPGGPAGGPPGPLQAPTPGAANTPLTAPRRVEFSPGSGTFTGTLSLVLGAEGLRPGETLRYELAAASPAGAVVPEPTAASAEVGGPLAVTDSTLVRAAVFGPDGTRLTAPASAHYIRISDSVADFSGRLPLVVLDDHGFGRLELADGKRPARLQLFSPNADGVARLAAAPAVATPVSLNVRGASSALFPKKSYSVELQDDAAKSRPLPLLGLAGSADWALVAPWYYDPAYLRSAFAYALSRAIGRWAPRTRFVEVFFKDEGEALTPAHYAGLAVLTERIKVAPDLVNIAALAPSDLDPVSLTGGYLLKFDAPDADEYAWITDHGFPVDAGIGAGTKLVVASPKADKLAPAQRDYIRGYVQEFENALVADADGAWATRRYLDYLDRASWIDFHLLQVLTGNADGVDRSAYFTKDRGGKLVAGPLWDFDRSLGSKNPANENWDGWGDASDYWNSGWWGRLTRDPDFLQAWIDRWQTLRRGPLRAENLTALADRLAAEIDPAAAARDAARWPDNVSRFGDSFHGEVDYLQFWIVRRAEWIDSQFAAEPLVDAATRRVTAPAGALLAYTTDGSDPRADDGALAVGAQLVAGPLLPPADGTLQVRAFYPDATVTFPGSPWSAPFTLKPVGPIAATTQLTNLSTRGWIAADESLAAGVVVTGPQSKRFLVRAAGPALTAFGIADALPDPLLRVVSAAGRDVAQNRGWSAGSGATSLSPLFAATGAFPFVADSADSALAGELAPGNYTVQIASAGGREGVALAELYALDDGGRAVNLSIRGRVDSDRQLLVGGIGVGGTAPRRLLIRAIGPSLAPFGVEDILADPVLAVFSGATLLAANDDWGSGADAPEIARAAVRAAAFPLAASSRDAATVVTLAPGSYTFQIRGGHDSRGRALAEVYELPDEP